MLQELLYFKGRTRVSDRCDSAFITRVKTPRRGVSTNGLKGLIYFEGPTRVSVRQPPAGFSILREVLFAPQSSHCFSLKILIAA